MATINGVTFNLTRIIFDTGNRNVLGRSPGSKTNPISNFGMDGLGIALTGFETSQSDYDDVMAAFMGSGSKALIVRTGWKFDIYSTSNNLSEVEGFADNYFPYRFDLVCSDPYQYSTSETTLTKTITSNNQEWSADDSANDITTSGTVDAVPDISVRNQGVVLTDQSNSSGGFGHILSVANDIGQTVTTGTGVDNICKVAINIKTVSTSGNVVCTVWDSNAKNTSYGTDTVNVAATGNAEFEVNARVSASTQYYIEWTTAANFAIYWNNNGNPYANGDFYKNQVLQANDDIVFYTYYFDSIISPLVYNTADTTVKCAVGNTILPNATHRINSDGTGTVDFDEDFTTSRFVHSYTGQSGVTFDDTDDEIDIADDGYIYYAVDCKYPITGIPILTAQINITAGTPTIQISTDASTWYDIDTVIVDDVNTEYELDNATSLSLKGKTSFYFRIDCGGTGTVTCSVKSFELDINIVTIDAENPVINTGAANTFRCDQDAASGMNCEVCLCYRDRKWAA